MQPARLLGIAVLAGTVLCATAAPVAAQGSAPGMGGMPMMEARPNTLDTSTSKMTDHRHFHVAIAPETAPVPVNRMHRWVLTVHTPDGKPVEGAAIAVEGGMPDHGHGLPTAPRVTKHLGEGRYLVEGVRFNMTGWWRLRFAIAGSARDSVSFNLDLK
ncbi:MAG: FixH family protein, partial [Rhodospirillaceae bacterium]